LQGDESIAQEAQIESGRRQRSVDFDDDAINHIDDKTLKETLENDEKLQDASAQQLQWIEDTIRVRTQMDAIFGKGRGAKMLLGYLEKVENEKQCRAEEEVDELNNLPQQRRDFDEQVSQRMQ
jgi:hypothetical protein